MINDMTQEQRAINLEKARVAREERTARFKSQAHLLKNDFADKNHWRRLASKYGVRFPSDYVPGSEARLIRRAASRAGVSTDAIRDAFGGDVKHMHRSNPTWPAYALIGLVLEIAG